MRPILPLAALLALGACAAPPPQNAAMLATLRPAKHCAASLPTFGRFPGGPDATFDTYLPPAGKIRTDNDSGWCEIRFTFAVRGRIPVIAPLALAEPPAHGTVALGNLDGTMRIAYRPAAGYAGADAFAVRMGGPEPWTIPVAVQVTR
ncbi:MAG: hypothetical protein KGI51_01550 [Rhodospirillales bacterium]|nr:hypothetical protein [Rhodospirillales bacterium]